MKVPIILTEVDENADIDALSIEMAERVAELTGLPMDEEPEREIVKASVPFPDFSVDEDGTLYKRWQNTTYVWGEKGWKLSALNAGELSLISKRISDREGMRLLSGNDKVNSRRRSARARGEFNTTINVAKSNEYENLVFGWANVAFTEDGSQVEDEQGHLVDVQELEDAAYNFVVKSYGTGEQHRSEDFGELVESMVFTKEKMELMGLPAGSLPEAAWWTGFRVPPEVHKKVRDGDLTMFSIEGGAKLQAVDD